MFAFGDNEWPGVAKFIEESGEMGQVLGRLVMMHGESIHWSGADLRSDFVDELADVKAATRFIEMKTLSEDEVDRLNKRADAKLLLFLSWHREQAGPAVTGTPERDQLIREALSYIRGEGYRVQALEVRQLFRRDYHPAWRVWQGSFDKVMNTDELLAFAGKAPAEPVCKVCDGGPGNQGSCLCAMHAYSASERVE